MVIRKTTLCLGFVLLSTLSGCGTVVSYTGRNELLLYGGVRMDTAVIEAAVIDGIPDYFRGPDPDHHDKFPPETWIMLGACGLIDLPWSAIADTLLLPITLPGYFNSPDVHSVGSDP